MTGAVPQPACALPQAPAGCLQPSCGVPRGNGVTPQPIGARPQSGGVSSFVGGQPSKLRGVRQTRRAPAELAWGVPHGAWGLLPFSRGTPAIAWALLQAARGGLAMLRGGKDGPRRKAADRVRGVDGSIAAEAVGSWRSPEASGRLGARRARGFARLLA